MKTERDHLLTAARLALRGHGRAEPNPLVGCVVVSQDGRRVVGWGYHERCGGAHAEVHALRRAGELARGATVYVTLTPCNHTGRTGPCAQALAQAGVARVVIARDDPNPVSQGGVDALRAAGVEVVRTDVCPEAAAVGEPFVHRLRTGLPWIIVKWAQTLDGRVATRSGESKWISSPASRRMVHRQRGRVDAILTGIGTVLRDDPLLTARGVRVRRVARRIVVDPELRTPPTSRVARSARDVPTTIVCDASLLESVDRTKSLREAGIDLVGATLGECGFHLGTVMRRLAANYELSTVMVEAGPGLCSALFNKRLVNEAWVFIGSRLLGDDLAVAPVKGISSGLLSQAIELQLVACRTRGGDVALRYLMDRAQQPAC